LQVKSTKESAVKPRATKIEMNGLNDRRESLSAPMSADRRKIARELAMARLALDEARQQINAEVEQRQRAQHELAHHVTRERERMRKQLHDGLGQVLTSISFLASSLRTRLKAQGFSDTTELDEITSLLQDAIAESRAIAATIDAPTRAAAVL
jgi:signal transduction histidine kinase